MRHVPIGGRTAGHRKAGRPARVLASLTAALAGLTMVAGCKVPFLSSSPPAATAKGVITVAATPGVANAPLYIASQEGMFSKAGLTVHITNYNSTGAELRALEAGQVDVAFADYADMFYAQAQALQAKSKNQLHLVIVADGYDAAASTMEVLTLPKSGIVSPRNLAHKTIGTPPAALMPAPGTHGNPHNNPYSLETVATQSVLTNDNVLPASISWQQEPPQSQITDLATHRVSAILATEPTIFQAESELGAVPVLDSCSGATANLPLDGYFSLRSFGDSHHAALMAFRDALERAQSTASQASTVRSTLQGSVGMSTQDASLVTLGQYPTSTSASDLQRVVSLMFFFNAIPSVSGSQLSVQSMIFH